MNVEFLRNIPLFATLSDQELALVAERLQAEQRVKNERLFRVSETSDTMYLLGRGFVNLTTESGLTLATLGAGSTLGEADLFRNARRTLNAVAAADLEVWSLSNTALRQLLQSHPMIGAKLSGNFGEQLVQMEGYLVDRLADVPALGDLSRATLVELARRMHPEHLQAGELLFRANSTPDGLFLVESGELSLRPVGGVADATVVRPGQLLGVQSLLTNRPYRHDAAANQPSLVWLLSPADFQAVNRAHPSLRRNLGRTINARLDQNEQLKAVVRLAQLPLFAQMDPQGLQAIAQNLVPQHLTAGEPIYGLDEPGDALYLVEEGEVELTVKNNIGVVEELARVTKGGFFGEMSLLTGKKRTEAATVTRDTNVWLLYKTELDALVGQYPSIGTSLSQGLASRLAAAEIQVDENRFRRFALFANGSQAELRDVAQRLRPTRYRAGEAVYRAGTRGDTMYLVERGSVRLQPYSGSSWVVGAGDFFGERAVLTDKPRSVSAFAETELDLLTLRKDDLEALMMQHPGLGLNLSRALSQRVIAQMAPAAPAGSVMPAIAPIPDPVPAGRDVAASRTAMPSAAPGEGGPAYVSPATARRRRTAAEDRGERKERRAGQPLALVQWYSNLSSGGKVRAALLLLLLIWLMLIAAPMALINLMSGPSVASGEAAPVSANALAAVTDRAGVAVAMASDQDLAFQDQLVLADQEVVATPTYTPAPTGTFVPTATPTVTPIPTQTPIPAATFTPQPVYAAPVAFVQAEVAAASVEEAPAPSLPPRIWDGRLDGLGVSLREAGVGSGQQFWRLIEVRWQNEQEGGGKHNIYVETLDEGGNRLVGIPVTVFWGDGSMTLKTEDKPAPDYAFSYPMYAAGQSYSIQAEGLPSDVLQGAGLGDQARRAWTIHVNYILVFQRTTMP